MGLYTQSPSLDLEMLNTGNWETPTDCHGHVLASWSPWAYHYGTDVTLIHLETNQFQVTPMGWSRRRTIRLCCLKEGISKQPWGLASMDPCHSQHPRAFPSRAFGTATSSWKTWEANTPRLNDSICIWFWRGKSMLKYVEHVHTNCLAWQFVRSGSKLDSSPSHWVINDGTEIDEE